MYSINVDKDIVSGIEEVDPDEAEAGMDAITGDVTADYLAELELARHDDAKQGIDMGDEIIEIHNEA